MQKNQSKVVVWAMIVTVVAITLIFILTYLFQVPKSMNGLNFASIDNSFESYSKVYEENYQNTIHTQVEKLKGSYRYDLENPLLIANPYNTVTNGVYVYFETEKKEQVQYIISCEGYEDFSRIVANGKDNLSTRHEWMMIGLIPGEKNTVTINTLNNKKEMEETITFSYDCPKAVSEFDVTQLDIEKGDSTNKVSDGLYAVLGNLYENVDGEQSQAYFSLYDNDGILRGEIPCVSYEACRVLTDENYMYFSVSGSRICRMDNTGYVSAVYKLNGLTLHHDYIVGADHNILVLGSDRKMGTIEDIILSVDLDTKEVNTIIDLKDIFPDYYQLTELPKSKEYLDWMHINSLSLMDDDSIIISSRETSTLIKLDNIYKNPTVDYLIGSDKFWEGTGYEDLLLSQDGEFSLQSGQHAITYVPDDSLHEGEYYLVMYNNNNTVSTTRPDYDWTMDDNYINANIVNKTNGSGSFYYKYLVNENAKTFSLVNEIEVDYSGYISSVQEYNNNIVIDSGSAFTAYEYDSDNKLIQKLHIVGDVAVYRVFKYDFKGFWFAE